MCHHHHITAASFLQYRFVYGLDTRDQVIKPSFHILRPFPALTSVSPDIPWALLVHTPCLPNRFDLPGQLTLVVTVVPLCNVLSLLNFDSIAQATFFNEDLPRPPCPNSGTDEYVGQIAGVNQSTDSVDNSCGAADSILARR